MLSKRFALLFSLLVLLSLIAAQCQPATPAAPPAEEAVVEEPTEEMVAEEPAEEAMAEVGTIKVGTNAEYPPMKLTPTSSAALSRYFPMVTI